MSNNFLQINYDVNNKYTNLTFNCSNCGTQNELGLDGLVSIKNIQNQLSFTCSNLDCGSIYDFESFNILVKIDGINKNNPYRNYVNVTEINQIAEIDNLLNSIKFTKTKSVSANNKELKLIDDFVKKNDIHPHNADVINVIIILVWVCGLVLAGGLVWAGVTLMKDNCILGFGTILLAFIQVAVTWGVTSLVNLVKQNFFINLIQMDYLKVIASNSLINNTNNCNE